MLKYVGDILNFRTRLVPESNKLREVEVVDTWAVRWTSRYGSFHSNTQPEIEVFASRELAEEFSESIKLAFRLLRHKGEGTSVTVIRSDR